MHPGLTIDDIAHTVHSHPTLSILILEASEAVVGRVFHKKGSPAGPKLRDILMEQFPCGIKKILIQFGYLFLNFLILILT